KDEIEKMKQDAEMHADEDKRRRELVDLKNKADALVLQTRRALEEHGGKVTPEIRAKVESALSNLEERIKGEEKVAIEAAMRELETASMELGKIVYEEAAKAGGGATQPTGDQPAPDAGNNKKDDVIDAEY